MIVGKNKSPGASIKLRWVSTTMGTQTAVAINMIASNVFTF